MELIRHGEAVISSVTVSSYCGGQLCVDENHSDNSRVFFDGLRDSAHAKKLMFYPLGQLN